MPAKAPILLINPGTGGGRGLAGPLLAAAPRLGIEAREEPGPRLAEAAREAAEGGAAALGVAGGDGSVAAVAGVAVEYDLPLVVVPTGTLNHFASDVGLSVAQPLAALEAFDGRELRVDVGRANGRLFVNNLSVGVYAEAVGHPDYRRHKLRTGWRALQRALAEPKNAAGLQVRSPGEAPVEEVLMAVIANNPHHLRRDARLGRRPRLDTGMLQVTAAPVPSVSRLKRSLAAELGVPIVNPPSPRQWLSRHAECEDRVVGSVRAGVDGESVVFTGPVAAWAEPGALRLLVHDAPTPQVGRRRYRVGRLRRWLSPPPPPVL